MKKMQRRSKDKDGKALEGKTGEKKEKVDGEFFWSFKAVHLIFTFLCKLNCVIQLKLYTVDKLSSPIFCCLSGIGTTKSPLFQIYKGIQALC